jgi:hypothetical protein
MKHGQCKHTKETASTEKEFALYKHTKRVCEHLKLVGEL